MNFCYVKVTDTPQSHITVFGKNLAQIRLNTTSSEANRPTMLYKASNALKKHDFTLSKLHMKVQPL